MKVLDTGTAERKPRRGNQRPVFRRPENWHRQTLISLNFSPETADGLMARPHHCAAVLAWWGPR